MDLDSCRLPSLLLLLSLSKRETTIAASSGVSSTEVSIGGSRLSARVQKYSHGRPNRQSRARPPHVVHTCKKALLLCRYCQANQLSTFRVQHLSIRQLTTSGKTTMAGLPAASMPCMYNDPSVYVKTEYDQGKPTNKPTLDWRYEEWKPIKIKALLDDHMRDKTSKLYVQKSKLS